MSESAIHLREYGEPSLVQMSDVQADLLERTGLVETFRTGDPAWWELRPGGRVGAVRVGDLDVRVAPKVDIERIVFLLGYRLRGVAWQESVVPVEAADDIVHVLANMLIRSITEAIRPGLLQSYRVTEEALPVVRGRIRIDEQLKRRPGTWLPVEVSYDDFTVDSPENQVLKAALERLQRNPLVSSEDRRRMGALLLQFADVARLVPGMPLPEWRITRINRRYDMALELARLVLTSSSFEHRVGSVPVDGFVLDVPKIFEDFVTVTLSDVLPGLLPGSSVMDQYPTTLDEGADVEMRPDVVWIDDQLRPLAVIDAKYKEEKVSGFPNADLYQCLAYATALNLPRAHLIYAKGNAEVRKYTVRGNGLVISAHALDLSLPPEELLAQVQMLAGDMLAAMSDDLMVGT